MRKNLTAGNFVGSLKKNGMRALVAVSLLCGTSFDTQAANLSFYGATPPSNTSTTPIQLMEGQMYTLQMLGKIAGIGNNTTTLQLAYTYGTNAWAFDSLTTNGTGINPITRTNVGNNGNLTASLYWTPTSMQVGNTYSVSFTLTRPGTNMSVTRTYYFYVNDDTTNNDTLCNKTVTYTSTNTACNDSSGSIDITVTGNDSALTYSWTGPNMFTDTTEDLANLVAGTYIVTISENGCPDMMDTIVISGSSMLTGMFNIDTSFVTDSCQDGYILQGLDTSVSVTITGGTPPYTYNWIAGALGTGDVAVIDTTNGFPTQYIVTVTDSNGCSVTLTLNPCILDVTNALCGKNNDKILICHKAGPNKHITLCIGRDGLADHLAHGDMLGACDSNMMRQSGGNPMTTEPQISVYPNPGNGSFTISFTEDAATTVTVTDLQGKVIYRNNFSQGTTTANVSIPNATTGIYFLNVQNGKKAYNVKIFVE